MSSDLMVKEIPLEKREIVYIVEDPGQRAFFYMEGGSVPANCTLVTVGEILEFDHSLTDLAQKNTILLWNDFENKYQPQEKYQDDEQFLDEFASFCSNYLGASKVFVDSEEIINRESNSKTKVGVSGIDTTTVDNTTVSPYLTSTAPCACLANSPFSTINFLPLKSNSNTFFILLPLSYTFYFTRIKI